MKLYLASKHVQHPKELIDLVEKSPENATFYLVVNAFDNYSDEKRELHISGLTDSLKKTGYSPILLDLRDYTNKTSELTDKLSKADLLWVSGGNVFYLRYLMKESGLDNVLEHLISSGLVYGGDSAGAAILGGNMHGLELLDDPTEAPEAIYEGLGITPFIILPHWGNERYKAEIEETKSILDRHNPHVVTINDNQVCIYDGLTKRILG